MRRFSWSRKILLKPLPPADSTPLPRYVEMSHSRLMVVFVVFVLAFTVLAFRLCDVALFSKSGEVYHPRVAAGEELLGRSEIVDRMGTLLAVNLETASLYANPKIILDANEAADKLHKVFPELPRKQLYDEFRSNKSFVWIKRNLTPKEQYSVNNLGIPGLFFERGEKRVYPHSRLLSHVLGYVGLDGKGLAGIEKHFDKELTANALAGKDHALQLSIDLRVQNIMHEELSAAVQEFRALGGTGIVMDATNGEVLALVSLPDFDPHNPGTGNPEQLFNRATLGVYEMGSSFKTFTMAMALDSRAITLQDSFDVNTPIKVARFSITDYHGKGGWLSVPEIFMYSSNIGTAKIGMQVGKKAQQHFLKRCGLLDALEIELPEKAQPMYPSMSRWSELSMMTISYGHGIAVTPLHVVKAMGSLVNGGILYPITLVKHKETEKVAGERVIRADTSDQIRRLLRLVVEHGTGSKAAAKGYLVGGKTGTAEKNGRGGYSHSANLSSFIGAFPMQQPRYVVLVILDEPKGTKQTGGYTTGGMTAAPIVGKVVSRMGPLYGMVPVDENSDEVKKRLWIDYKRSGENL